MADAEGSGHQEATEKDGSPDSADESQERPYRNNAPSGDTAGVDLEDKSPEKSYGVRASSRDTANESGTTDESPERQYGNHSILRYVAHESGRAGGNKTKSEKSGKKTGRIGGLEKAVSESSVRADTENIDYLNTRINRFLAEHAEAAHGDNSDDDQDTSNGVVTFIYKRDKKTGELEFLFEQKPIDYPDAGGKLSLVGGYIKRGEKSLEALVRELREEIKPPAAPIIIESLSKNSFYKRVPYEYHGTKGYTDIYAIEITNESRWNAVKSAVFQHDAGFPRVLKQHELHVDDFAFGYGKIAKKFADENSSFGKKSAHFPYADSAYIASSLLPSLNLPKYSLVGLQIAA